MTASKHHAAAWHALTCPCDDRDLDVALALEGSRALRKATHADARLHDLETAQLLRAVEMGCRAELSRVRTTRTPAVTAGGAFARGGGSGWSQSWGGGGTLHCAAAGCMAAARAPCDPYDAACAAALRPPLAAARLLPFFTGFS